MKPAFAIFFSLIFSVAASAQFRLIPVAPTDVGGAQGSHWVTEHWGHNSSNSTIWVTINPDCPLSAVHSCDTPIPAQSTVQLISPYPDMQYLLWSVTEGELSAFTITSFVRNDSTGVDPWGTLMPTPLTTEFHGDPLKISPVTGDPAYRVSLRVFALTDTTDLPYVTVQVESFTTAPGAAPNVMKSFTVNAYPDPNSRRGTYFESHDIFGGIANRNDSTRYTVRIMSPANRQVPLWAFASVTNNATQHVTVFTP